MLNPNPKDDLDSFAGRLQSNLAIMVINVFLILPCYVLLLVSYATLLQEINIGTNMFLNVDTWNVVDILLLWYFGTEYRYITKQL